MQGEFHGSKKRAEAEEKLSPSLPASPTYNRGKRSIRGDNTYPHNKYKSISDSDRQTSAQQRRARKNNGLTHNSAFQKVCAARDMLYVTDKQSNRSFLVDTGAAVSLIPYWGGKSKGEKADKYLTTADGTPIKTYAECSRNPSNLGKTSTWQT